jgi:hypothetical protein
MQFIYAVKVTVPVTVTMTITLPGGTHLRRWHNLRLIHWASTHTNQTLTHTNRVFTTMYFK